MAALTPNQLDMIRAIASNDMPRARKAAQAALAEDESKKNFWDVGELKRMLDPSMNPRLTDVPHEIKGLIEVERPAESFIIERYYLSPREKEAFDHIVTMQSVCGKLAQMRVSYPNSTLLYGPSGTGKTTFGRYVACKLDLPFYYMNFARVMDSYLGGTQRNVAKVFDYARSTPCVLMLDEIDAISTRRRNVGNVDGELNRVTITIMQELDKPGRDPRKAIKVFEFDKNVRTIADLREGMILPGIVGNITNFGAFVDIGIKENGLVHLSQLAERFISDPTEVVSIHQHVMVRVMNVDYDRKRIQLSMIGVPQD